MKRVYIWHVNKRKYLKIVIVLAFMAALFLWLEKKEIISIFPKVKPTVLTKGNHDEKKITLTFNISWGEKKVHGILKELKENDVQATFFVSGEWAERHPDIIKKIVEEKHELGMLGYRYKSYLDQEIDQVRKDLIYAKEIYRKLGHEDIKLLRTPSGHFNKEIVDLAKQLNFTVVHWSVNPNDWENPGVNAIIDLVMKETSNGDIILLHASDSAKQTADALQTILPGLKEKDFKFVPISELISQTESEAKLVE